MKKFYLKSMGCKANQFEGQIVAQRLVEGGFEEVCTVSDADSVNSFKDDISDNVSSFHDGMDNDDIGVFEIFKHLGGFQ